jgi:hypothetical protein
MSKTIANSRSTAIKLSETQLSMLSAAARREDRCLSPSASLRGAALRKTAGRLIEAGLVREVPARPGTPVWRRDDETGRTFALKLTALGAKAVAVDGEDPGATHSASEGPVSSPAASPTTHSAGALERVDGLAPLEPDDLSGDAATPRPGVEPAAVAAPSAAPRAGSKLAKVVDLLARGEGASIDDLIAATDWLPHTTRAALTGLRKRGYAIERNRENGSTFYRLHGAATPESSAEAPVLSPSPPPDGDRHEAQETTQKSGRTKRGLERTQSLSAN